MYYFNRFFNIFINKICGTLIVIILILVAFFLGLNTASAASVRNITLDNLQSPVFFYPVNCTSPTSCYSDTFSVNYDINAKNTFYYTTSATSIHNSGVYINYKLNSVLQPGYLYSIATYVCSSTNSLLPTNSFTAISGESYGSDVVYSSKTYGYYSASQVEFSVASPTSSNVGYLTIGEVYNGLGSNPAMNQCGIYYDVFSPSTTSTWYGLQLTRSTNATDVYFLLAGYNITELGLYSGSLNAEISNVISNSNLSTKEDVDKLNDEVKNQVQEQQQTNQKLDDLNNNITSDDTSGGNSEGSSFFNDFEVNDNGGISGIITSPLKVINKMLEGNTCENLTFNLNFLGKNKQVSLPSGCIMWNKAPQSAVTIYQTLLCGLFSYILATNLFKDIEKLKNPKESEVDTLDL